MLPDPGRVLSKHHCSVSGQDGAWLVTDISSNGTWLNGEPLEYGVARDLRSGDRVTLGAYELEVQMEVAAATPQEPGPEPSADPWGLDLVEERLTGDPFTPAGGAPPAMLPGIGLPAGFDPLVVGEVSGDGSLYPAANHVSDLGENFRAPRPSRDLVPEGWELDHADLPAQPGAGPQAGPDAALHRRPRRRLEPRQRRPAGPMPPPRSRRSRPAPASPGSRAWTR